MQLDYQNERQITYDPIAFYYDLFYTKNDDVNFYLEIAKKAGPKVLELCCGTGRILIQFAKQGFEVTGIDISKEMLMYTHKKIKDLKRSVQNRIRLIQSDIRDLSAENNYNLVILAFSSFMELPTQKDREICLRCCYNCLTSGGILVMDNLFQGTNEYINWGPNYRDGRMRFRGIYNNPIRTNEIIQHFESDIFNENKMTIEKTIFADHIDDSGVVNRKTFKVCWYYRSPEQIREELKEVGFKHIEIYGCFTKKPIYDVTLQGKGRQIVIAKL